MVDGDDDIVAALISRDRLGHVRSPNLVHTAGNDRAFMRIFLPVHRPVRCKLLLSRMIRRALRAAVRTLSARSRAQTLR